MAILSCAVRSPLLRDLTTLWPQAVPPSSFYNNLQMTLHRHPKFTPVYWPLRTHSTQLLQFVLTGTGPSSHLTTQDFIFPEHHFASFCLHKSLYLLLRQHIDLPYRLHHSHPLFSFNSHHGDIKPVTKCSYIAWFKRILIQSNLSSSHINPETLKQCCLSEISKQPNISIGSRLIAGDHATNLADR